MERSLAFADFACGVTRAAAENGAAHHLEAGAERRLVGSRGGPKWLPALAGARLRFGMAATALADIEREHVARVFEVDRGNQSRAARILGINEENRAHQDGALRLKRENVSRFVGRVLSPEGLDDAGAGGVLRQP